MPRVDTLSRRIYDLRSRKPPEIVAILGCSINSVRVLLHRMQHAERMNEYFNELQRRKKKRRGK